MAIPFGQPTTFTALLNALEDQLAAYSKLPRSAVFASLASDEDLLESPPADRFIAIRPLDFPADLPTAAGGGRVLTGFNSTWDFTLFVRLNNDQEFRSPSLLKNATGVFATMFNLVNAAQMFTPMTDLGTACVLREPGRMLGWRLPTKPYRQAGKNLPWFVVPTRWELKFTLAIDS